MQINLPDHLPLAYLSAPYGAAQYWVCKFYGHEGAKGATAQAAIDAAQRERSGADLAWLRSRPDPSTRFDLELFDDLLEDL